MNILFIGDIVGKPGRRIIQSHLSQLIQDRRIDFVIANGENAAHGKGITSKVYHQLISSGINCITLGNHAFSKRDIIHQFHDLEHLLFPANLNNDGIYPSSKLYEVLGTRIVVTNLLGQVFMNDGVTDPFKHYRQVLEQYPDAVHICDFHAEATAEKQLFARVFAPSASLIVGTHTHVQTADEQIIEGCGYISDVGMTGVIDSILGRSIEEVIDRNVHHQETFYTVAHGRAMINAVVCTIQDDRCVRIERISIKES